MCSTNDPNSRSSTSPTAKAGSITIRTRLLRYRFPAMMPWTDTERPLDERVDALLAEMTLDEKLAQLASVWVGAELSSGDVAPMAEAFSDPAPWPEASANGMGHITRPLGTSPVDPADGARRLAELQADLVERTRLKIPAIAHEECLTGFTTYGATVFPTPLALAATFDPAGVERMTAAIGASMRATGAHQGLSPVLDVVRDHRWGRVEETFGEDPYLVGTMGTAYVRGLESAGLVATLKHFAGYSASLAARNHAPVSMGRRELLDVILPPFETAVTLGRVGSVMNSYADVDGIPAGSDPWLLTDVLRGEWGFTGTVVSDYWAVPFLASMHRIGADADEAGALALAAGIDVEFPDTLGYGSGLVERVRRGELPEELVDRAARRALIQKAELGLLDPGWTPEGSIAGSDGVHLDSPANRALARELAERSVVLLDAGTALPLLGEDRPQLGRIAVVGPCADDGRTMMGCYAFPNHVLPRHPDAGLGIEVPTVVEALRAELPGVAVVHEQGCAG